MDLFGYSPTEMIGLGPADLIDHSDIENVLQTATPIQSGDADRITVTFRGLRRDGSRVWVESTVGRLVDPKTGEPLGSAIVISRDVTARKELEERLLALASTDGLTELANRRTFDETLTVECARAMRRQSPLSILLIDVDNFKRFNDQFGHQIGDTCLRAVAAAVKGCVRRPGDLAGRYGGEEIAIILPETSEGAALSVAEEVRQCVENLSGVDVVDKGVSRPITVSIGVATACSPPNGPTSPAALLQAADSALYRAKRNGRNRVEVAVRAETAAQAA